MSMSIDGFVAGPDQNHDQPLGAGGEAVHEWHLNADEPGHESDRGPRDEILSAGAYVMGRNMFGPVRGEWHGDWRGWWGDEPPYRAPVFVLTHYPREPVVMQGGTTFHFVTDGLTAALDRAHEAAGGHSVDIAGGAATVQQALNGGVLDELLLSIAPVMLGVGERLFDNVVDPGLEPVEVMQSPYASHIRYRIARASLATALAQ